MYMYIAYMYMYWVYMYLYIYPYMCMYTYRYMCSVCTCNVHVHAYASGYVQIVYAQMHMKYICMRKCICACTCRSVFIHTYVHTYQGLGILDFSVDVFDVRFQSLSLLSMISPTSIFFSSTRYCTTSILPPSQAQWRGVLLSLSLTSVVEQSTKTDIIVATRKNISRNFN